MVVRRCLEGVVGIVLASIMASDVFGALIPLQQPTATFSQSFGSPPYDFSVSRAIDGAFFDDNGWAIYNGQTVAETAAFETVSNVGLPGGTLLTFTLYQSHMPGGQSPGHLLGRFRLSATTADRSDFADGNDGKSTPGDVGDNAIWTVLSPATAVSTNGATLTVLSDNSILSSGLRPDKDIYTVTVTTLLTDITGFRLEVLEDDSLPDNGPGRADNGNFVLTEFQVDDTPAVPEPSTLVVWSLLGASGVTLGWRRRKRRA
jgi:hypothetical protein